MVQAVYGDVRAKCPQCRQEPELRRQWGCDAPAVGEDGEPMPVLAITCSKCDGFDPACDVCSDGEEDIFRCPQNFARDDVIEAMRAYRAWDEHNTLPVEGGLLAQAGAFLDFCDLVTRERGVIERERAKKEPPSG